MRPSDGGSNLAGREPGPRLAGDGIHAGARLLGRPVRLATEGVACKPQSLAPVDSMERICPFPHIGGGRSSDVARADVLEILLPICHAKPSTARYVHMRIRCWNRPARGGDGCECRGSVRGQRDLEARTEGVRIPLKSDGSV